jgi:hypothetical protein
MAIVSVEPRLPGELLALVEHVDEVHEKDSVLPVKLPRREPANLGRHTNLVPSN